MKYTCKNCNYKTDEIVNFCPNCGTKMILNFNENKIDNTIDSIKEKLNSINDELQQSEYVKKASYQSKEVAKQISISSKKSLIFL